MFSRQEKTRFNTRPELKNIVLLIEELRGRKENLKRYDEESKRGTLDYRKYIILKKLFDNVDKLIENYNNNCKPGRPKDEDIREITILLIDFMLAILKLTEQELKVISTPRNDKQKNANMFWQYGSMGAGTVLATTLGGPLVGGAILCTTGLISTTSGNEVTPRSAVILVDLIKNVGDVLKETKQGLSGKFADISASYDEIIWMLDQELDDNKVSNKTLYFQIIKPAIEVKYKNQDGTIKKHVLNDIFTPSELQNIFPSGTLTPSKRTQGLILWSLHKSILQVENEERLQKGLTIAVI